jgi:menaquinone-specific isochorismate synthase
VTPAIRTGVVAARFVLEPGPPIDPFALAGGTGVLFHSGGRVRVGLGSALHIALPGGLDSAADLNHAVARLAAIPGDEQGDRPSGTVTAFSALPFERSEPGALVVPEVTYGRDGSNEWVTVVAASHADLPRSPSRLRSWLIAAQTTSGESGDDQPGPVPSRVVPRSSDSAFVAMVSDALEAIGRGDLIKVVLARHVQVTLGRAAEVPDLLRRWHDLEPNCTVFSVPSPLGQFVGASPELLVERNGSEVISRPLAGTAERFIGSGGSVLPGALLESGKDAVEHRLVVDAIAAALGSLCAHLEVPAQPDLVHLHNIVHLGTTLRGTLARQPSGTVPDALALVAALHPTPAVGGVPAGAARAMISRLEPEPRGHYAGPVGYVDGNGDGRWMLGIRALTLDDRTARLTAGVGIVAGSEPAVELVETNLKFTAVLDALAPGGQATRTEDSGQTVST